MINNYKLATKLTSVTNNKNNNGESTLMVELTIF
jgi:hypothetical protein